MLPSVNIKGNSFNYFNGQNNPGWLEARGTIYGTYLSMVVHAEDISIENVNVYLFFNKRTKTIWCCKLTCDFVDVVSSGDKQFNLETLDIFHLKNDLVDTINYILQVFYGPSWKFRIFHREL